MFIALKKGILIEHNLPNRRNVHHLGGQNWIDPVSPYNRESCCNTCFRNFWLIPHSRPGDK